MAQQIGGGAVCFAPAQDRALKAKIDGILIRATCTALCGSLPYDLMALETVKPLEQRMYRATDAGNRDGCS